MMRLYTNGPEGPPTPDVALMLIRLVLGCSILVLQLCLTGARCSIKASPVRAAIPRMRLCGVCRVPLSSDLSTVAIKWEETEVTKCCSLSWQWSTPLQMGGQTKFKSALWACEPRHVTALRLIGGWFRVRHHVYDNNVQICTPDRNSRRSASCKNSENLL